jgi:hypothetical protein
MSNANRVSLDARAPDRGYLIPPPQPRHPGINPSVSSRRRPGPMSAVDTGFRRYDKLYVAKDLQQHGRTVEAEHRMILEGAIRAGSASALLL